MLRTLFSFGVLGVGLLIADSLVDFGRSSQIYDPQIFVPPSIGEPLEVRVGVPQSEEAAGHANAIEAGCPEPSAELAVVLYEPWKPILSGTISDTGMPRFAGLKPADMEARRDLTRDLQSELARVGCYAGRVHGQWSFGLEKALKEFNVRLNSALPTEHPDYAQLTLIRSQNDGVCGAPLAVTRTAVEIAATDDLPRARPRKTRVSRLRSSRPRISEVEERFLHPLGRR